LEDEAGENQKLAVLKCELRQTEHRCKKRLNKKFKKRLKNVKNVTNIKQNVCKRNKKRYLFLVYFNSTPNAEEMAFEATRNMPFSLVLQKLSSF